MAEEKKVVTLDNFEQRLMVSGLMDFRNDLLRDEKPTEDINDLILKVIDAPTKKEKRRADREARYVHSSLALKKENMSKISYDSLHSPSIK